jgi:hypothetical protein
MGGGRFRGIAILAILAGVGWWVHEKKPTIDGIIDDLTQPFSGSRAALKESEHKRIVGDASQIVTIDDQKPLASLHEGMTDTDVRKLLGEPDSIELGDDERGDSVRWIYRGAVNRVVLFQRNRVVSIAVR